MVKSRVISDWSLCRPKPWESNVICSGKVLIYSFAVFPKHDLQWGLSIRVEHKRSQFFLLFPLYAFSAIIANSLQLRKGSLRSQGNKSSSIWMQPFVFFLFCIRLDELVEFNWNQSSMTEGYWKLFCVSHSQLALWCNGYVSCLGIRRLWVQIQEFLFLERKV